MAPAAERGWERVASAAGGWAVKTRVAELRAEQVAEREAVG